MNLANSKNSHVIVKIASLTLENFRGFSGTHKIDTDADLVLITGPNGYGKTSFIEALLLVLAGWHHAGKPELLINKNADGFVIKAEVRLEGSGEDILSLRYNQKGGELKELWHHNLTKLLQNLQIEDPELNFRLCGFFQDRVEALFDEITAGHTLRDVFEPLPMRLKVAKDYLRYEKKENGQEVSGELAEDLKREFQQLERKWNSRDDSFSKRIHAWPDEKVASELVQAWNKLVPLYEQLINGQEEWPQAPKNVNNSTLTDFTLELARKYGISTPESGTEETDSKLPGLLEDVLIDELARQLRKAKREAVSESPDTRKIQADIVEINAEKKRIENEFPELDKELAFFKSDHEGLPDLEAIFRSLSNNISRWAKAPLPDGYLTRLREELGAVKDTEAEKCAQLLDDWQAPRNKARERLQELKEKEAELQRRLKASMASEEVERLRKLKNQLERCLQDISKPWWEIRNRQAWEEEKPLREKVRQRFHTVFSAIEQVSGAIENVTRPDETLMEKLKGLIETVLRRFSLVDGIVPLKLEGYDQTTSNATVRRGYTILTNDERGLGHLSTGQKAQMAVSLLAAQNLAVSHMLHHRTILLDDVTTAYDLSNLTREAILWRQLAYGGHEARRTRRQVFISSHHEDMTNHLLDLLVPPEGRSMRLVRFTGWSLEQGPQYDLFKIEPTGAALNKDGKFTDKTHNLINDLEAGPWQSA